MKIARRPLLGLGAATLASGLLSGCETVEQQLTRPAWPALPDAPLPPPTGAVAPAVRLLHRAGFGPRPGEVARVQQMGAAAWVEEQLRPEQIAEEPAAIWRVRRFNDWLQADAGLLFDFDDRRLLAALQQATLLRAVYSRRPLYERMVAFWTDHFNIYARKGDGEQLKIVDDRETIRKHALGRFRDLLGASARSAAMLGYLDNTVNRKGTPNENYARELMELHTLGVDSAGSRRNGMGGYTQNDVLEVARCFTGWTSERRWHRGRFQFDAARHDDGPKRVLGLRLPAGGGIADGEAVLDRLAAHPSTARHIARKLCFYFRGDAPEAWVVRLAAIFEKTGGDIPSLLRPLLTDADLVAAPPILKRPFDYVVSALRALNADTDGGPPLLRALEAMGQPLFCWPRPDGFPTAPRAWTGTLLPRWNFALALTGGTIKNTTIDWPSLAKHGDGGASAHNPHDRLLELVFGVRADRDDLADLRRCRAAHPDAREYAAVLLMSPQFQWR